MKETKTPEEVLKDVFQESNLGNPNIALSEFKEQRYMFELVLKSIETYHNQFNSIPYQELEDLYFAMGEDWHLWDEKEKGAYPIDRTFSAMEKFLEAKQKFKFDETLKDSPIFKPAP